MPRTFLNSECIVLGIFMIQCCIIICVILCIGRYILVETKLQFSCIAIKLLSYCTLYMYFLVTKVKEVKSETKSGQTPNRSHKPVHNLATTGTRRSQRSKINQGHNSRKVKKSNQLQGGNSATKRRFLWNQSIMKSRNRRYWPPSIVNHSHWVIIDLGNHWATFLDPSC